MKQSLRQRIIALPGLGYCARVAANVFRLPKTNADTLGQITEHQKQLENLHNEYDVLREDVQKNEQEIAAKKEHMETIESQLRLVSSRLADITHDLSNAKLPAAKSVSTTAPAAKTDSNLLADDHTLDQFYIEFENKFRGKEKDIQDRLKVYLPYFKGAKKGKKPVVDIGCGRGEFLKLLKENNIKAKGLDLNESMVKRAAEQGLDVVQADAKDYLHKLPSGSVYAVTGFHIVEHIPFAALLRLMDECYRAIQDGGYAIFETPNPENVLVGTHNFYHDPSHLNPVPPALLAFVMETRGFSKVEIKRLHPMETNFETQDPLVRRMAERMFGPSDYAVIARK